MLKPHNHNLPGIMPNPGRPRDRAKPRFKALTQDGALEMLIYGEIVDAGTISMLEAWGYPTDGFVSSMNIKKAMDAAGAFQRIRLRINSPGGDAFEGFAIHSLISAAGVPVDVCVDGVAASSASIIAMSGSTRTMGPVSMMMIHNARCTCTGNRADMYKAGDTLGKLDETIASAYTQRTGKSLSDVMAMMNAETWLSAKDCLDQGFATGIAEVPIDDQKSAMAMARNFRTLNRWRNLPDTLRGARNDDLDSANGCECDCKACIADDCGSCSNRDCDDSHCEDCPMQAKAGNSSNLSLYLAKLRMLEIGQAI